ncbi:MAG TPA: SGNH/GDSL hydrolase family protein [Thermoleophilaceae bacterium]|jgi:lysophospholipase L1-like esterase
MRAIDITAPPLEPEELTDRLRRAPWRRYVTLGDSLVEGIGDPVEGYPEMGWAEATGRTFKELHADFEFLNLGKRFLTADRVRMTQLQPALDFEPDLAAVLAGGNDLGDPFDPGGIERELDRMVAALSATGATVMVWSVLNMMSCGRYPEPMVDLLAPRLAAHRDISLRVAERYDTVFFDCFNHPMCADPSILSEDLLHINMRGQALLTEMTLQGLASLVPARTAA